MKLSSLLTLRETLLQQARLANLGFAYAKLADFTARAERAGLNGDVALRSAAPEEERYCASLVALEANQSVIEEHFTDEDVMDFADVVAFVTGQNNVDVTFRIEAMGERFLTPLREELLRIGVILDVASASTGVSNFGEDDGRQNCSPVDGHG